MSDKQGHGDRLFKITGFDASDDQNLHLTLTQASQQRGYRISIGDTWGLFDPATERVVPKDAEVWTREELVLLIDLADESQRFHDQKANHDELIAQARGKGE